MGRDWNFPVVASLGLLHYFSLRIPGRSYHRTNFLPLRHGHCRTGGPPILAAADGIVVDANAIDPWGESYGYYIKIQHDESFETLYTHCLTVFVMDGEEVDAMEFFNKQTNLFRAINHSK